MTARLRVAAADRPGRRETGDERQVDDHAGLAVLCGLGAMFGTNRLISKEQEQADLEMQDVLVAARDLKVEEVIKPDMVKLIADAQGRGPRRRLHLGQGRRGSLGPDQDARRRADPRPQARPQGEPGRDWSRGSPRGCGRSPSRSTSIRASPGSSSPTTGSTWSRTRPAPTASSRGRDDPPGRAGARLGPGLHPARGPLDPVRTVTLAVTPEQVDILVAAHAKGALTLALRGLNDHDQNGHEAKQGRARSPSRQARAGRRGGQGRRCHRPRRHRRRRRRRPRRAGTAQHRDDLPGHSRTQSGSGSTSRLPMRNEPGCVRRTPSRSSYQPAELTRPRSPTSAAMPVEASTGRVPIPSSALVGSRP